MRITGCADHSHWAPHADSCRYLGFQVHGAKTNVIVIWIKTLKTNNYNALFNL
jgi:hypothetical protein